MSKGLINEILNNIADLTNLQTGEVDIDIGDLLIVGRLTSDSGRLGWTIPLGRVLPKNTTITKVTGEIVVRVGSHNTSGLYIWRSTGAIPAVFDTSENSIFLDGAETSRTILPSYWYLSLQGESNLYMEVVSSTSNFFSGNATNGGYVNNQPCSVELSKVKITVDIPTNSIYVPQATITLDAPNTTVVNNGSSIPGTIQMYAGSIAPEGFLICDGSAINRIDYSVLFSIIGQTYGAGDGVTTFNIPDLRGRVPLGVGTGTAEDATTHALGQIAGEEGHTITTEEMAAHTHGSESLTGSFRIRNTGSTSAGYNTLTSVSGIVTKTSYTWSGSHDNLGTTTASNPVLETANINATHEHDSVGSDQAHNNMQPYLAINYIIATGRND